MSIFNLWAKSQTVDDLAALRLLDGPVNTFVDIVEIRYHTSTGDGGGGKFIWDSASTQADDDGVYILPTGHVGAGRWVRQRDGRGINVRWFGAKADGTTDLRDKIQAAIDLASSEGGGEVFLPADEFEYTIDTPLVPRSFVTIAGDGPETVLKSSSLLGASGLNSVFFLGNYNSGDANVPNWAPATAVAVNDRVHNDSSLWICSNIGSGTTAADGPTGLSQYTDANGVVWERNSAEQTAGRRISMYGSGVFYETGNLSRGDQTLTFSTPGDGSNFSAGDIVAIRGSTLAFTATTAAAYETPLESEMNVVTAADANTISLQRPMSINVTGGRVRNLSSNDNPSNADILGNASFPIQNVHVKDMSIRQNLQNPGTFGCFQFGGNINCSITNVYFDDCHYAISLQGSAYLTLKGLLHARCNERFIEFSYGVHDVEISDIDMSWKEGGEVNNLIALQSTCRNVNLRNFRLQTSAVTSQVLAITGYSNNILISNGIIHGLNTTGSVITVGVSASDVTPTNCLIENVTTYSDATYGIELKYKDGELSSKNHMISGCRTVGSGTASIFLNEGITNCHVIGNRFTNGILAPGVSSIANTFSSNKDSDLFESSSISNSSILSGNGLVNADLTDNTAYDILSIDLPDVSASEAGTCTLLLTYHLYRAAVPRNFSAGGVVLYNAHTDDSGNIVVATPLVLGQTESLGSEYSSLTVCASMIQSGTTVIAQILQTNDLADSCRAMFTVQVLGQSKNSVPRFDLNRLTWEP